MIYLSCQPTHANRVTLFFSVVLAVSFLTGIPDSGLVAHSPSESSSNSENERRVLRQTEWNDMMPHTKQGSYYNEFWVYHIFLENDLHLHITFSLANFGTFKSAVSGGKLFVSNFRGNSYHVFREFPLGYFEIDEERQKIRLHPGRNIYFQGKLPESHHLLFETTKDNVSYLVDLTFEQIHQGYTMGDGRFQLGGEEMGMYIHIPRAGVYGTVAVNDDTLQVNGTAYMDHTWQTDLSSKVIDKGFRYISHTGNGYSTGYYLLPNRRSGGGIKGIGLLKEGSGDPVLKQPDDISILERSDIGGNSVPETIDIGYDSGERITLKRSRDFQHVSFLEEVSGLRKRLVRSFLGGEIIEYVGLGTIDNQLPVNYNFLIVH